ncbi:MAG: DUF697 domain-containing protein [Magnetococcales bacterium]|nr:DUF697 domain-containing protein [Magnetococcales bacterium]
MRFSHPWIAPPQLAAVNGAASRTVHSTESVQRTEKQASERVEPDIFNDASPAATSRQSALPEEEPMAAAPLARQHSSSGLIGLLTFLFVSMLTWSCTQFVSQLWQWQPVVGFIFSVLLVAVTGTVLTLAVQEWRHWRRLARLVAWRQQGDRLLDQESYGHAYKLLRRILHFYRKRPDLQAASLRFQQEVDDEMEDAEQVALFSSLILTQIDHQAYTVVRRHATTTTLVSATTPILWLDALFFLWRSVSMVQEVAALYGIPLGRFGAFLLLRRHLHLLLGAGAADLAAEGIASSVGDSITAVLAARAGQGVANGLFLARIGLQTMHICRPLPFLDEEQPSLTRIAKALQQEIKNGVTQTAQKWFAGEKSG